MRPHKLAGSLTAAALLATVVAGCSGGGSAATSPSPSGSPASSASAKPADDKPMTISIKNNNNAPQDPNSPLTKELEKLWNVKLNYVYIEPAKEAELLNLRISSGDIPDVMKLFSNLYSSFAQQGVLAEIPLDMIQKYAPTYYKLVKQNGGDNIFDFYKVNGKNYALPDLAATPYNFIPIWRDDWLKAVGIAKTPETLEEAEAAFYKFVNNDPDGNGKKDTYALSDKGMIAVFGAFGSPGIDNFYWSETGGQIIASGVLPGMKDALKLLRKWYKDGLIDPEFITGENKGQYFANSIPFWNGKIGFTVPGVYYHVVPKMYEDDPNDLGSAFYQNFKKVLGDKATYAAGLPWKGPSGEPGILKWGTTNGNSVTFGKQVAGDPRKMQKVLEMVEKFHADFDYYKLARYGVKGQMYELNPVTGLPYGINDYKDSAKWVAAGIAANGIGMPEVNHEFFRKTQISPKVMEYAKTYSMATTKYNKDIVFAGLPSDGKYKKTLETKIKEWYVLFITGQKDADKDWDSFLDDLNKNGLAELTKEANDWYKTYFR
ncbi:type 2 periplasmic-binding domain-containing protein [Paenibacillus cymbidii]|uniref:hypothetical protein n=1 Tax=Paenibacillus cymbidii TaxID=1639034 RepID=UPI00108158FA|nr:hypothetical protein [Paenibacillus cymbidii]